MPKYKLQLSRLKGSDWRSISEEIIDVDHEPSTDGEDNLGIGLTAEFRKAVRRGSESIPDLVDDLVQSPKRTIEFQQFWDVRNTESMWLEIANTVAEVRFLLCQAQGYK